MENKSGKILIVLQGYLSAHVYIHLNMTRLFVLCAAPQLIESDGHGSFPRPRGPQETNDGRRCFKTILEYLSFLKMQFYFDPLLIIIVENTLNTKMVLSYS
jgi:hypothetical protein